MKNNIGDFSLREELGNKGYNLLLLKNNGFLIPETFIFSISNVNEYFFIQDNGVFFKNKELLENEFSFLQKNKQYIFRSSSLYEDSSGATFAGLFESVVSSGENFLQSIIKVLESYLKEEVFIYAKKKNIDFDRKAFQIAILIQEFIVGEFAGVCNLGEKDEIIEMSRGDNLSITATGDKEIFLYDSNLGKNTLPTDFFPEILDQVTKKFLEAKKIFDDKEVLIEWTYKKDSLIFLQIREFSLHKIQKKQTFFTEKEISWNEFIEITKKLLQELGFFQNEWFLHETGFTLDFRYIKKFLSKSDYNSTFTIFLFVKKDDIRLKNWFSIKNIEIIPVLRPKIGISSYLDSLNEYYNVDYTFSCMSNFCLKDFAISENNIGMYSYNSGFLMNIFRFYSFDVFKTYFDNNIGDYKSILDSILYDRKVISFLFKNKYEKNSYNKNFLQILGKELRLNSEILSYIKNHKEKYLEIGETEKISGEVIFGTGSIEGIVISNHDLDGFIFDKHKNYFYVSYDFEPFYMRYIDFLSGMIVTRGNYLCHGVAVCKEFGLPIICSTKNINLLKTGDNVRINFLNGEIILI